MVWFGRRSLVIFLALICTLAGAVLAAESAAETVRVFIFAGQSNMVGSDSKVADIERFPPYAELLPDLAALEPAPRFSYVLGRETKKRSDGWVDLAPVGTIVGPELSFVRDVARQTNAPIAIIKVAAGGTTLCADWNPDEPGGFKMYPLALDHVRKSLAALDADKIPYRLAGFMWHQGENDMFKEGCMPAYGENLANFFTAWRRDLEAPALRLYVGELCTKTIWGMDLRSRIYTIREGQVAVTAADPLADYVKTSHNGVEIGRPYGLHYHYGTLGQLHHGSSYAAAYLERLGLVENNKRQLKPWPYKKKTPLTLYVLAGHRNMEGERAFVAELPADSPLREDMDGVAFRYSLGGGVRASKSWEPLGPTGYQETFGPELSFARTLRATRADHAFAIAKFTHSGSQMNDWTPEPTAEKARHLYPDFIRFVRRSVRSLEDKGHTVNLQIVYHVGENDMSWGGTRNQAAEWLNATIEQSRVDLGRPDLPWLVSQQEPTEHKNLDRIDVVEQIASIAAADPHTTHLKSFDLPGREQQIVITTPGIVTLGEGMAERVCKERGP